ncbi:hypothetical protein RRF57_005515 [Xylaria bambusicola]|uniref:Uncharacterized protein n=1 Tax=Xylaria bambusicola TaxID=326684 RepID=A0AAN7UCR8_9PEZI
MTLDIRIDPPGHEHKETSVSVSKRRDKFEHPRQVHSDIAVSSNTLKQGKTAIHQAHTEQDQQQSATSTTRDRLSQSLIER